MAICNACGAAVTRVRTILEVNGKPCEPRDECPQCCPGTFEKLEIYQKPALGWEAYPTMYRKRENPLGGYMYEATDEMRVDTEAKIAAGSQEDRENYARALAEKRRNRRTKPLSSTEIATAVAKVRDRIAEQQKSDDLQRQQYENEISKQFIQ